MTSNGTDKETSGMASTEARSATAGVGNEPHHGGHGVQCNNGRQVKIGAHAPLPAADLMAVADYARRAALVGLTVLEMVEDVSAVCGLEGCYGRSICTCPGCEVIEIVLDGPPTRG